ncbi:sulfatase-like hydrolase/transferase [Ignatzschineria ureiclastica]|nr:sulfatase-like hydrolase/transferase [Ignatzschineria ureiclastica]
MVEWWGKLTGYLVQLIATLVLVTLFIYTKRVVKYLFLIMFLINSLFYLTFYKSVGTYLTFSDLITLLNAKAKIDDAIMGYGDQLLVALLMHIPFVIVYLWPVTIRFKWGGSLTLSACYLLVLFSYTLSLLNTQGRGLIGRPGFILPTVQFALYTYVNGKNRDINEALKPKERPDFRKFIADSGEINTVIMTIDESINWDLIDLNYNGNVTPSLYRYPEKNIVNFGRAVSYANCSDLSNASIRKFVRYGEEEKDLLGTEIVYIWEIVKQAGFVPYLIDAQANGVGHNYFTKAETDQINIIKVDDESDAELIDLIVEMRDRYPEQKQFYLVIKQGAHLPYYKEGIENYFSPVMQNASLSQATREEIINTYKNRARFETDRYFEAILEKLPYKEQVAIVYTSDHGQTFDAPGQKSFHCDTRNPDIKEAIVPLLFIGPQLLNESVTIENIKKNQSIKSHYYIPALIMMALGYKDSDIAQFTEYFKLSEEDTIPHFVYDRAIPFFQSDAQKKELKEVEIIPLAPQS